MKQLKPKKIIAIGLPGSLAFNVLIAATINSIIDIPVGWITACVTAFLAWLLFSLPIFLGMALIRHRIGKQVDKLRKIRTAIVCLAVCLSASLVSALVLPFSLPSPTDVVIVPVSYGLLLTCIVSGILVIAITGNLLVRSFEKVPKADPEHSLE